MQHNGIDYSVTHDQYARKWRYTIFPKKELGSKHASKAEYDRRDDAEAACKIAIDASIARLNATNSA